MKDHPMHAADLDLEDLPPKALRKLIKAMLAKMGKSDEKGADEADDERQKLSELHAEHKGKPPEIPVTDDDLPPGLRDDEDNEEVDDPSEIEEEAENSSPSASKGKQPPALRKAKSKERE